MPILSHQVLDCRPHKQEFIKKRLTVEQATALAHVASGQVATNVDYWIRETHVVTDDTQFTLRRTFLNGVGLKKFDKNIFTVVLDQHPIPRPLYVVAWGTKRGKRPLFCARVDKFNVSTGIFSFRVAQADGTPGPKEFALQVFRIIRDVYHRHVWTRSGDIGISPVIAKDQTEAAKKIWDDSYGERIIIERHHDVNERFNKLRFGCSSRAWLDAFRVCSTGLGELSYAKAMAHLTELDNGRIESIDWARNSFQNLFFLLEQEQAIRRDHGIVVLLCTILATLYGSYFVIKEIQNQIPALNFIGPIWGAVICTLACLLFIYAYKARVLRKGKNILSPNQ